MLTPADIQFILENEGADINRLLLGKSAGAGKSGGKGKSCGSRRSGKSGGSEETDGSGNGTQVNVPLCVKCIQAREKMKVKAPLWYNCPSLVYPFSVSVEQGSSQATAIFKQQIISRLLNRSENANIQENTAAAATGTATAKAYSEETGHKKGIITADLTGGMGIDSYFISRISHTHYYFERNAELCTATKYNFGELGAGNIVTNNQDITENGYAALHELEDKGVDLIYIDPARRTQSGGKAILLQDYEPNIIELQERLFAVSRYILVKVSPMADIKLNLKHLPQTAAIWVVSVANECKELLFLLDREHSGAEPPVYCDVVFLYNSQNISNIKNQNRNTPENNTSDYQLVVQEDNVTIKEEEEATAIYATEFGKYLYEPNKSLLKAGAFKLLSQRYSCSKLAPSTHLYTSEELIEDFPGKKYRIEEVVPFSKKSLKEISSKYPKASLTARNFPMDTNALKKLSGINDGGDKHLYATTLNNGNKVIIITAV